MQRMILHDSDRSTERSRRVSSVKKFDRRDFSRLIGLSNQKFSPSSFRLFHAHAYIHIHAHAQAEPRISKPWADVLISCVRLSFQTWKDKRSPEQIPLTLSLEIRSSKEEENLPFIV